MQTNILRDSNVTKIFLIYVNNGSRKREAVKLRFMDNRTCLFAATMPVNFVKPKRKTPADIYVYTPDGVYRAKVSILGANLSFNDLLYEVSIPKRWEFIQLRTSSRKQAQLPLTVKYNDGFTIHATSYDLSMGGISYISTQELSSIYKKITGILTVEFPSNSVINFPDGKLTVETKFVREKDVADSYHENEHLNVFRFIGLSSEDEMILKQYLIKLD